MSRTFKAILRAGLHPNVEMRLRSICDSQFGADEPDGCVTLFRSELHDLLVAAAYAQLLEMDQAHMRERPTT